MRAIVACHAGKPEVLELQERPIPTPEPGWVLIQVKAFGLNRAEIFTRQGHSPGVTFPRVLGIECVGIVVEAPGTHFRKKQKVAAIMGGMGRDFDGGYAEYTCVPASSVFAVETNLDWSLLGAIPEMFQTAWGALNTALEIQKGQTLLIRGGTSSVGMTAACLAKRHGLTVLSTTRNPEKSFALESNGVDHVLVDNGKIALAVQGIFPKGVHRVLELIGTKTLIDSLECCAPKGITCMAGILGNEWQLPEFEPMTMIPSSVKLTSYSGDSEDMKAEELQQFIYDVAAERIHLNIDKIFKLNELVAAHHYMETNQAAGKLVVTID